jgi:uncharacterized membrane protein
MPIELLVLRATHILAGTFWVGAGVFSTLFLMPALATTGPATAGAVMQALERQRLFTAMPVAALLTIGSGLRLLWIAAAGAGGHYFHTRMGHAFTVSGGAAILAFVLAMFVVRPTMVQVGALAAKVAAAAPEPSAAGEARYDALGSRAVAERRLQVLRARGAWSSAVATLLLVASALGMAVARYL